MAFDESQAAQTSRAHCAQSTPRRRAYSGSSVPSACQDTAWFSWLRERSFCWK
jgi:hypothetical protein